MSLARLGRISIGFAAKIARAAGMDAAGGLEEAWEGLRSGRPLSAWQTASFAAPMMEILEDRALHALRDGKEEAVEALLGEGRMARVFARRSENALEGRILREVREGNGSRGLARKILMRAEARMEYWARGEREGERNLEIGMCALCLCEDPRAELGREEGAEMVARWLEIAGGEDHAQVGKNRDTTVMLIPRGAKIEAVGRALAEAGEFAEPIMRAGLSRLRAGWMDHYWEHWAIAMLKEASLGEQEAPSGRKAGAVSAAMAFAEGMRGRVLGEMLEERQSVYSSGGLIRQKSEPKIPDLGRVAGWLLRMGLKEGEREYLREALGNAKSDKVRAALERWELDQLEPARRGGSARAL